MFPEEKFTGNNFSNEDHDETLAVCKTICCRIVVLCLGETLVVEYICCIIVVLCLGETLVVCRIYLLYNSCFM